MSRRHSLTAYHARKRVEAQLELERLRRSAPVVQRVPVLVPGPPQPCNRRHIGPGSALLMGLGAIVLIGILTSKSRD